MIKDMEELRGRLDAKYLHPEFDLSDLRLLIPGVTSQEVHRCELALNQEFPIEFKDTIVSYDFAQLSVAGLNFAYGRDLSLLISSNSGDSNPWFGQVAIPRSQLVIGSTDGHWITISTTSGELHSVEAPFDRNAKREQIASGFVQLVLIAGAIALEDFEDERLVAAISASPNGFWQQLVDGTA